MIYKIERSSIKMENKVLIVVDMQNDFIDGALGTKEAQAIVPNVKKKIEEYRKNGGKIIYTYDTHAKDYLQTHEGKNLPVPHCIKNSNGWQISDEIAPIDEDGHIYKICFGYNKWNGAEYNLQNYDSFELIGLCTDICVVSNALILRSMYPEKDIFVDASCCAGVTPEKHAAALEVMKSCHINIIGE